MSVTCLIAHGAGDVFDLTLEELLDVSVESVSGNDDKWWRSPAAVTVITREDILNSGRRNLPEILRGVPGLHVAQIESSVWTVSSRGFPSRFANKLLVLIDGRSIYNPLFAGVYWDTQNLPVDAIDRIEVIRGPGSTLWGSNAVNGVINVITRHSSETAGSLATLSAGSHETGSGSYLYGGKTDSGSYRIWGESKTFDALSSPVSGRHNDDWTMHSAGFRGDVDLDVDQTLMITGGAYGSDNVHQRVQYFESDRTAVDLKEAQQRYGGNLLARWAQERSESSHLQLQSYIDFSSRDTHLLSEKRFTWDVDLRHRSRPTTNQAFTYGVGYRLLHDDLNDSFAVAFDPDNKTSHKLSAYAQDEIELHETLSLSLGLKYEYNNDIGHEWQPGIRAAWTPGAHTTTWLAVTRAVRVPARVDLDYEAVSFFVGPSPSFTYGDPDAPSEELTAYELGLRQTLSSTASIDLNVFYNDYDNLSVFNPQGIDRVRASTLRGESYGAESTFRWHPTKRVQLNLSYSYLQIQTHGTSEFDEDRSPHNQASANVDVEVTPSISLHGFASYVGDVETLRTPIPAYVRMDLGLRWKISDNSELSIWGRNLLDNTHSEFDDRQGFELGEIERSVLIRLSTKF